MEQALQALQALYSSADPGTITEANDWLTKFQQTPAAWQVSDQILSQDSAPVQFRFFAAQTLRTKVQFDFYELPAESYGSLRDSLLGHVDRFRSPECQPIHTMLAIAVADLAIQMDAAWPDVIPRLFERFGQSPESYATLLEVVRMLPEENMNLKLMTDTSKRQSSRERLQQATPQVVQFLLTLQCPTVQAKRKVLECFLSWVKFTHLPAGDIAQNPLLPECFKYVTEGGELSETATDILIEVLRMSSPDLASFQPVVQLVLSLLGGLRAKFEALTAQGGEAALRADHDGVLQLCRIYVETGECLVPLIMEQSQSAEVLGILEVILRCTDLPLPEVGQIPLDFWHRLANEVCRHPETDAKINQFQGVYRQLLAVALRRCRAPLGEDPFQADDDWTAYRRSLLGLAEDCLEILTPNSALEQVLASLQEGQREGVSAQEAHFFVLTTVGARAEVREGSVLWQLVQSLPPLIAQPAPEGPEGAHLHFAKKTAVELLGQLWNWVRERPELLRSALEMVSQLLLQAPGDAPLERVKQTQQAAAIAFKEICVNSRQHLQDLVPQLTELYVSTMQLPIRMHLFVVDGIGAVVAGLRQDEAFRTALTQLVAPLVSGLSSEKEKPQLVSEILDRLTMVMKEVRVHPGSAKAAAVGQLVREAFWPLIRQMLVQHPGDAKVVEKSCRLLKHSMRCVPDLFKPLVPEVAQTLVPAFQVQQHSSYLYSAEILANTYASDPEVVPVLTQLFHALSGTALQCLAAARGRLEEITELVEDFYGMFERYLRYAPMIVLEAPTLPPALQLWHDAIFVQQKDTIEAVIAFVEAVLGLVAEVQRPREERRARYGALLRPQVLQVGAGFTEAIFRLVAAVPTRYVQESIHCLLEGLRAAFPQEFPGWLEAAFQQLPPSAASRAEQQKLGEQLVRGDDGQVYEAVQDVCYRCEQVALRH
eukprot:CAMPEP_0171173964 /NCGR_PEP_ID=MMETSP0790-20130122/10488_1 /TAXON_ID=2925 /ORGANISM="Alexandrium catenella, Strain OF101" /LENGTH=936 /DNA_ID=CAMNT_0011638833 /DNA_START=59 /DNA_END=2866 /DNA_ORIENTATION=-